MKKKQISIEKLMNKVNHLREHSPLKRIDRTIEMGDMEAEAAAMEAEVASEGRAAGSKKVKGKKV